MNLLYTNVTAITMDPNCPVLKHCYVATQGKTITAVGTDRPQGSFDREIDCTEKLLMPGLVNAHTHVPMTLLRGYGGGNNLQDWLNKFIFPAEAKMDETCIRLGTQLAMAELLAAGVTTIADMYSMCDTMAQVVAETGLSANLSRGIICFEETHHPEDLPGVVETRELIEKWNGHDQGRIRCDVSIHGEYTSFLAPKLWDYLGKLTVDQQVGMHVHISETQAEHQECIARHGKTPLAILAEHGVWEHGGIAAHCVWTEEPDWELMLQKGISPVHNPVSNLKLGSGVAPVGQMLAKGVNVALGTDGVASNNNHDMFEEIKTSAVLHKGVTHNPTLISSQEALNMATVNGAKALRRHTGVIAEGYDADIILLDASRPSLFPCHDPVEQVVFSARGGDVCLTQCQGNILYENGLFHTLDLAQIKKEITNYAIPRIFG